jgi:hypothetical protein
MDGPMDQAGIYLTEKARTAYSLLVLGRRPTAEELANETVSPRFIRKALADWYRRDRRLRMQIVYCERMIRQPLPSDNVRRVAPFYAVAQGDIFDLGFRYVRDGAWVKCYADDWLGPGMARFMDHFPTRGEAMINAVLATAAEKEAGR